MRILWLTNTPSKAAKEFGYKGYGGGWISSLEDLIQEKTVHQLGICFFYSGKQYKKISKGVHYYGIPFKKKTIYKKLYNRHFAVLDDNYEKHFNSVIEDFQPDIIHVFGTESGYGQILKGKFDKVVFHLQGLISPASLVYFPKGIKPLTVFQKSNFFSIITGDTFLHKYILFKKRGIREEQIIKSWNYFMGRTDWDRNYLKLLNPHSLYFHCDEMLRESFFRNDWEAPKMNGSSEIIFGTTINPNIYKGLDVIYKTIAQLKDYKIKWKIFGIEETEQVNHIIRKILNIKREPRISFYGQIDDSFLISELRTCHFFIHPSYIDNSPNSVCEAMMLGMPVLSSSVGGIKSLIKHNVTGYLFNPYDEYDLPALITSLVSDYDSAIKVGREAR